MPLLSMKLKENTCYIVLVCIIVCTTHTWVTYPTKYIHYQTEINHNVYILSMFLLTFGKLFHLALVWDLLGS